MDPSRYTSKLITLALAALASALTSLYAQSPAWQSTEGPYHGTANCFIKGPNNYLYAGTEVGVFRTPLGHDAWQLASGGLIDRGITALAVDSSGVLYAGTAEGAFRSFDEGAHWEIVNFGLGNTGVRALLAAPHGVILAGTGDGIYRSIDQASSWTKTVTDSANASAVCFAVHPSGDLYAGGAIGLMRSSDDGEHWTHLATGFSGCSALTINRRGFIAVVYAWPSMGGHLLGVSKDSARTFYSPGLEPQWAVSVALDDANHLFLGTISEHQESYTGYLQRYEILESSGPTLSLQLLNKEFGKAGPTRSVFATEGNRVFASAGDVISSTDSGATFHNFMIGLTASRVLSLIDNTRGTIFAGTEFALFHHPDTASGWSNRLFLGGDYFKPVLCLAADSSGLVLAGSKDMGGLYQWTALYLSLDFGAHWRPYDNWGYITNAIAIGAHGRLFATLGGAVVRAPDHDIWKLLLAADAWLSSFVMRDSAELYTGSALGTVYCSYDTGMTWTSTRLVPAGAVQSLALASGGRVYAGTSVGFFASSDRGSSWVQRGRGEVPLNIRVLVAKPGVGIFAGTADGVYRSTDEGERWEALNQGLASTEIYALRFGSDGYLYAGTSGGGVYRMPLEVMAVEDTRQQVPVAFTLRQNYPNPFNPTTTVEFEIPHTSPVKIIVYDLLGREVAPLLDRISEPGRHRLSFNAEGLASGIYLLRMQAGPYSECKKIVLVR